jgi:DNA-binding XRE family transcriptional regulator
MSRNALRLVQNDPTAVEPGGEWWHLNLLAVDQQRVLRGWTRGELARRAHVDPGTISDMFRGRRRPTLATIQAIAITLELNLADIITFDDGIRGAVDDCCPSRISA